MIRVQICNSQKVVLWSGEVYLEEIFHKSAIGNWILPLPFTPWFFKGFSIGKFPIMNFQLVQQGNPQDLNDRCKREKTTWLVVSCVFWCFFYPFFISSPNWTKEFGVVLSERWSIWQMACLSPQPPQPPSNPTVSSAHSEVENRTSFATWRRCSSVSYT